MPFKKGNQLRQAERVSCLLAPTSNSVACRFTPIDKAFEAAEFGVSASQHVFGFGGKLVRSSDAAANAFTKLVAFLECHLTARMIIS